LRNIYLPEEIARHGFIYESVGRARSGGLNPGRRASDKHGR